MEMTSAQRRALDDLPGKSLCTCGHLGDSNVSPHAGLQGHGPCMVFNCECRQFSWDGYTQGALRIMGLSSDSQA